MPIHEKLACLQGIRWSDNLCTVGATNIHATGWTHDAVKFIKTLAPSGRFTQTSFTGGDERRAMHKNDIHQVEAKKYGAPVYVLARGAYFDFSLGDEAMRVMVALGLTNELMRLMAGGGRHKWPQEFVTSSIKRKLIKPQEEIDKKRRRFDHGI